MLNNYEVAEVVEIGKAQDVILGNPKDKPIEDDSPFVELRDPENQEDE